MVFRVLVEKKEPHGTEAKNLLGELQYQFGFDWLKNLRVISRYDVEGIGGETFEKAKHTVFSEPATDNILETLPDLGAGKIVFAAESLPGQYDQRADACSQCLQLLEKGARPLVRCAKIYIFSADNASVPQGELDKVKKYIINPVERREVALGPFYTLQPEYDTPPMVETLYGFTGLGGEELAEFAKSRSFAMDMDDLLFCQDYFRNTERRDPTITEMRMIDTYWSDHCRHTTFLTEITEIEIADPMVQEAFTEYLGLRGEVYNKKNKKSVSLMDLATIGAKYLKMQGILQNLDESEEVNACSVNIKVNIDGRDEEYLLMFKNETHNHPTEIEPFGGAATALGGDIRDVMAGRAVAYQGMRVTGAADPRKKFDETIKNKLPQFKITRTAADGFSSYGNQFGAATGLVCELYHDNYAAKRLELGAVIGAVPKSSVRRLRPIPGDAIILLGGRTGRDACGGATSSSKSQDTESLKTAGAEVQKGDPLEGRKILRLFSKPQVAQMIKRCNDFGAGGVSVAIGELADSIFIDLSLVPTKYGGLDGTELAISESQERMAVVVAGEYAEAFIYEAYMENLEATKVATVTDDNRLRMIWNGIQILSLDRKFLNSNGAKKQTKVAVPKKDPEKTKDILGILHQKIQNEDLKQAFADLVSDLNICSQKGLSEQFDFSVGAKTVLAPFGGRHRLTPAQVMAGKIPVHRGNTDTCSVMAHGFSPYISEVSPYMGAMYAVVESVSKLIAAGVELADIALSFQEYFPRANTPEKFGLPFESLLGALSVQTALEIASIGGKDSMSGSFSYEGETGETITLDVPPTLVSFAVGVAGAEKIVSNEFKRTGSYVYLLKPYYKNDGTVDLGDLKNLYGYLSKLIKENMVLSAYAVGFGGVGEAVFKMCAGNGIGFSGSVPMGQKELFSSFYGAFVVESGTVLPHGELIGQTKPSADITINSVAMDLNELTYKWLLPLEEVFPTGIRDINEGASVPVPQVEYQRRPLAAVRSQPISIYGGSYTYQTAAPKVLIPVFPGTNGEYDAARQIEEAGGFADVFVFGNKTPQALAESFEFLYQKILGSQMVVLPGGSAGGDEPGGAGKFIACVLREPKITEALRYLLFKKDGLMLGLGNGFQALVRLGLLPYGDIKENPEEGDLTVTFNKTGRYRSYVAYTRVASVKSPWFAGVNVGDVHAVPVSHGEGRVFADGEKIEALVQSGQVATQYCDLGGRATMHPYYNPATSAYAIEGLFGPDGRVFGKMGHSERNGRNILKNVPGNKSQLLFTSGIKYFK